MALFAGRHYGVGAGRNCCRLELLSVGTGFAWPDRAVDFAPPAWYDGPNNILGRHGGWRGRYTTE